MKSEGSWSGTAYAGAGGHWTLALRGLILKVRLRLKRIDANGKVETVVRSHKRDTALV